MTGDPPKTYGYPMTSGQIALWVSRLFDEAVKSGVSEHDVLAHLMVAVGRCAEKRRRQDRKEANETWERDLRERMKNP